MRCGSSWPNLVGQGGQAFLQSIAESYFVTLLNSALVSINFRIANEEFVHSHPSNILEIAIDSIHRGFWLEDYEYKPPDALMAKSLYRIAMCARLWPSCTWHPDAAQTCIRNARRLLPDDRKIKEEEELIERWIESLNF